MSDLGEKYIAASLLHSFDLSLEAADLEILADLAVQKGVLFEDNQNFFSRYCHYLNCLGVKKIKGFSFLMPYMNGLERFQSLERFIEETRSQILAPSVIKKTNTPEYARTNSGRQIKLSSSPVASKHDTLGQTGNEEASSSRNSRVVSNLSEHTEYVANNPRPIIQVISGQCKLDSNWRASNNRTSLETTEYEAVGNFEDRPAQSSSRRSGTVSMLSEHAEYIYHPARVSGDTANDAGAETGPEVHQTFSASYEHGVLNNADRNLRLTAETTRQFLLIGEPVVYAEPDFETEYESVGNFDDDDEEEP